jgi:mRNA-degrading endonuclease YafQ of YafQ-DinJ toxin-antitoxin module
MKRYIIIVSKGFQKKYKKLVKKDRRLEKLVKKSLKNLRKDPFYFSLKTHKVSHSVYGGMYSSRVTGDIRIIWNFDEKRINILALDIGTHGEVYK